VFLKHRLAEMLFSRPTTLEIESRGEND